MNNEIKEIYPKAYNEALKYFCKSANKTDLKRLYFDTDMIHTGENDRWEVHYNVRDFYDFFDSKEIYCSICYQCYMPEGKGWIWSIDTPDNCIIRKTPTTRAFSEKDVFTKAFEILEKSL